MCETDKILELLRKLPKQHTNSDENTEDKYNIFDVLGVEYNEVIICRFIGDLLDPKGSHELGTEPLREFICSVLKDEVSDKSLETAIVRLEEKTDNDRRIDIVIHLQDKIYPIEVKIWAGDQDRQLADYYTFCFGDSNDSKKDKIYYLTPNGWEPSEASRGESLVVGEQICLISFSEHIKNWLKKVQKTANDKPVKYVIKNFVEVIDRMSEQIVRLNEVSEMLGLDKGACLTEDIDSAIILLKYRDELWDRIRKNYISQILDYGEYKPEYCGEKEKDVVDYHTLIHVKKGGIIVARICVDWNLYIVTDKKKDNQGWTKYKDRYQWKYITHPQTGEPILLKLNEDFTGLPKIGDKEIKLTDYLT